MYVMQSFRIWVRVGFQRMFSRIVKIAGTIITVRESSMMNVKNSIDALRTAFLP